MNLKIVWKTLWMRKNESTRKNCSCVFIADTSWRKQSIWWWVLSSRSAALHRSCIPSMSTVRASSTGSDTWPLTDLHDHHIGDLYGHLYHWSCLWSRKHEPFRLLYPSFFSRDGIHHICCRHVRTDLVRSRSARYRHLYRLHHAWYPLYISYRIITSHGHGHVPHL